jgi:hypothetical protein
VENPAFGGRVYKPIGSHADPSARGARCGGKRIIADLCMASLGKLRLSTMGHCQLHAIQGINQIRRLNV